jgi:hypothetical protein
MCDGGGNPTLVPVAEAHEMMVAYGPSSERRSRNMGVLTQRVHDKLNASQWTVLRDLFVRVSEVILGISPDSQGELAGNYVKFVTGSDPMSPVYSVVWPKMSEPRRLIIGLTLPKDFKADSLGPPPERIFYRGLTKFVVIEEGQAIPEELSEWVKRAYEQTLSWEG